jgi:hypothetical protein
VLRNALAKSGRCGKCRRAVTFYSDASLHGRPKRGSYPILSWHTESRDFELTDAAYRCPSCDEMKMRFIDVGCWD